MTDWSLRDTVGIVIVLGVAFSAATSLDGLASALVAAVGAVIALLWIANFVLRGYTDALDSATDGR
ncbi:MAG: hypothetical protein V5A61_11575 [Haloarculaceae archaeon]|jgi:hypothetical protein